MWTLYVSAVFSVAIVVWEVSRDSQVVMVECVMSQGHLWLSLEINYTR